MTKKDLTGLILESMQEYFAEQAPAKAKNTTMKKSEIKSLVKEVVRQCIKEGGPQYKIRNGKPRLEQPGKINVARQIQYDPTINEEFPEAPEAPEGAEGGLGDEGAPEMDEVRLLKGMAMIILKLLKKHQGMDVPEDEPNPVKKNPFPPKKDKTPADDSSSEPKDSPTDDDSTEDPIKELKVQARSFKTVKDNPSNPKNVRDQRNPMS